MIVSPLTSTVKAILEKINVPIMHQISDVSGTEPGKVYNSNALHRRVSQLISDWWEISRFFPPS